MELTTSAQMRGIERRALESGEATGAELMERAGEAVAGVILDRWAGRAQGRVGLVLCGPGNNGGDGFVIARRLRQKGWVLRVLFAGVPARLPPDALEMHDKWSALGSVEPLEALPRLLAGEAPSLVVDALFGTGLRRDLEGEVASALWALGAACAGRWNGVPVVAVDVPSGLCADSGRARGPVLPAALTVTFHCAKPGHYLDAGPDFCGDLMVADIGLRERPDNPVRLVGGEVGAQLRKRGGHKYDHGHALVLAGGPGRGGAARMAARAALRIGAGLVTLGVPPSAQQENAARLDAVMLRRVGDAEALAEVLSDRRINALCLGPGLGLDRARGLAEAALMAGRATLLDADALSVFEADPAVLFERLGPDCVLTPHGGEFRRLFPDLAAPLIEEPGRGQAWSRLDAVRAAAERAGCVVLLKGRDTVIAAPGGAVAIHAAAYGRATPWLATAGAGDVLAGLITGLMARGLPGFEAACAGAYVHVEAALAFGPGLIAEDLPDAVPGVLRRYG